MQLCVRNVSCLHFFSSLRGAVAPACSGMLPAALYGCLEDMALCIGRKPALSTTGPSCAARCRLRQFLFHMFVAKDAFLLLQILCRFVRSPAIPPQGLAALRLQLGVSSAEAEARCIQVVGPISFLAQGYPRGALLRQAAVGLLDLAQVCGRLGLALQAGLLRHRPCPCGLRLPHVLVQTAPLLFGVEGLFRMLRFIWTLRVRGWALRVFSPLAAPARRAPSRVNTARATCGWWLPPSRVQCYSSQQNDTCSKWCALACDRAFFPHGARAILPLFLKPPVFKWRS